MKWCGEEVWRTTIWGKCNADKGRRNIRNPCGSKTVRVCKCTDRYRCLDIQYALVFEWKYCANRGSLAISAACSTTS